MLDFENIDGLDIDIFIQTCITNVKQSSNMKLKRVDYKKLFKKLKWRIKGYVLVSYQYLLMRDVFSNLRTIKINMRLCLNFTHHFCVFVLFLNCIQNVCIPNSKWVMSGDTKIFQLNPI